MTTKRTMSSRSSFLHAGGVLTVACWSFLLAVQHAPVRAETVFEPEALEVQCRALAKKHARALARCRTTFQLGKHDPDLMGSGWDDRSNDVVLPDWVPRLRPLLAKSNMEERAMPVRDARARTWRHDRGAGGEYRSYALMAEVIVHDVFIRALEDAGFVVSDWTSVPSRQDHALDAGARPQTHLIVGSQPGTCRSVHVRLLSHVDPAVYPYGEPPFGGSITEVQVAYREPEQGVRAQQP